MKEITKPNSIHNANRDRNQTSVQIFDVDNDSAKQLQPNETSLGLPLGFQACLTYCIGWVSGVFFIIFEKNPYVLFHAWQSVITFAPLMIVQLLVNHFFGWMIYMMMLCAQVVVAVFLMYNANLHAPTLTRFKLPLIGPLAHRLAGE
jgi:uncharacterized membrane protein